MQHFLIDRCDVYFLKLLCEIEFVILLQLIWKEDQLFLKEIHESAYEDVDAKDY